MPLTMKKLGLIQFFSWFAFFTMWSMANPAITEHVFNCPCSDIELISTCPIKLDLAQYNSENLSFQKASNLNRLLHGYHMGYPQCLFALILTLYTSKRRINRKMIHLWSLIAGGIGFLSMYLYLKSQPITHFFWFNRNFLGKYFVYALCYVVKFC